MLAIEALMRRVRLFMARNHPRPFSEVVTPGPHPRPWMGKDGLRIPRAADVRRLEWEQRFLEGLLEAYTLSAQEVRVVRVPTELSRVEHANGVRSEARYSLYRRMLAAGEPVPPIYVEPTGARWFIRDGNHRTHAARNVGVQFLIGITPRRNDLP